MPAPVVQLKPATVKTISLRNWEKGVVTANDVSRTPEGGLAASGNTILFQDGTIRPRPSLVLYGTQPTGTVLGEIAEFRDTTVTPALNYRICMQVVAGVAKVYTSKDLGAWAAISGKTYDTSAKAHYCQIGNKVVVMNGTDSLSYYDIPTATVIPFTALTTPTAPTLSTNTGLTGTTFTITYRITANSSIGESLASTVLSCPVSTDRDLWNSTTQSLAIAWSAVTSAKSYNVYMGVAGSGTEFLIASGITGTTYTDNGTGYQDNTKPYPLVDSTAGPKATRGTVINGQLFLSGIKGELYNIKVGGTFPNQLDLSPANGGNTVPIGQGTKELPVAVRQFRANNGTSAITVFCSGTNGRGKRYILAPDTLTVQNNTVNFFNVTEDNGEDGTDAPDGILYNQDSLYYPSTDGFKTTGTLPQIQNVLSTRRASNTIQPDIASLNTEAMANCVGVGYEGRLYWAVPADSTTNNQIWILDLERGGAWMKPWNIAADWMMLYNSNTISEGGDGKTHHIVLSGNKIYELTYSQLTNDDGVAFSTSGNSGQIFFSPDQRQCAKLLNVIFTFLRPSGTINVGVNGQFRTTTVTAGGSANYDPTTTVVGWSEQPWSARAWSEVITIPESNNVVSTDIKVKVNKELRWFQYSWSTTMANTDYQLADITAEFVPTGIRDL